MCNHARIAPRREIGKHDVDVLRVCRIQEAERNERRKENGLVELHHDNSPMLRLNVGCATVIGVKQCAAGSRGDDIVVIAEFVGEAFNATKATEEFLQIHIVKSCRQTTVIRGAYRRNR
jgi:hypothetical protein